MQNIHPCFSEQAHVRYARIHLPVARDCNLGCNYCERLIGGASYHSYRPAVCERLVSPAEALSLVRIYATRGDLKVAGIAGPGEPLYNEPTYETLRLIRRSFPELLLCLSTNGLLLSKSIPRLRDLGVSTVTVTVNTINTNTARKLYSHATIDGRLLKGEAAADAVVKSQMPGVARAADAGILVKVNTILIPDINAPEVGLIAHAARDAGACIQNITPLIPLGRFRSLRPPSCLELWKARQDAGRFLDQFTRCRQCRADSVGVPGHLDSTLELS